MLELKSSAPVLWDLFLAALWDLLLAAPRLKSSAPVLWDLFLAARLTSTPVIRDMILAEFFHCPLQCSLTLSHHETHHDHDQMGLERCS